VRRRIASGLLAVVLAASGGTVPPAPPARADICGDLQTCVPSADTIVKLGFTLFKIGKGVLTVGDLEAALLLLVGLMDSTQNEIIAHTDNVLVQNALGRMRALLIEAKSYEHLRDNEIMLWTLYDKALTTVEDGKAVFRSVSDRKGKDDVARAVLVEYPIAAAAIGDYAAQFDPDGGGAQFTDIENGFRETLRTFRTQLEPQCHKTPIATDYPGEYLAIVDCEAATGHVASRVEHLMNGVWINPPVDIPALEREAGVGSAWLEAVQLLESLGM
jgi:hypothetical protein